MRVIWSPSALAEVARIQEYVAEFNPAAAAALAKALMALGNSLSDFPYRGRPVGDNLRDVVPVRPYIILYEVVGERVQILRVRHGMRRP